MLRIFLVTIDFGGRKSYEKVLRNENIHAIYSSSDLNTQEIASVFKGENNTPLYFEDRLKPMQLKGLEKIEIDKLMETHPEVCTSFMTTPHLFEFEGLENFYDLYKRTSSLLNDIKAIHTSGNILIIAKYLVAGMLFNQIKRRPIEELWKFPVFPVYGMVIAEKRGDWFGISRENYY
ncbi:histidine phosphatase family protein [Halobacillus massiliensis]|uniref:histidine phosphatase family protein n=1 Tax=Halobacillus massiliensis TaxID=1926286 RepID=UPI0009E4B71D|nr:histidine phosphatase family protein [Halobacillus massiliensis]